MFRKLFLCTVLIASGTAANAGVFFEEGFDSRSALDASGWLFGNFSDPAATLDGDDWFQGNTGIFDSQSGAADSYVATNFLSAEFGGDVDTWMVTPLISTLSGSVVTFSTRTAGFPGDNLQLLYNNTGSLFLSDFVSMGTITSDSYPTDWTAFNFTYGGGAADVRFAFRYTVTDTANFGDYIGVDSLSISVPEPGTMMLLGAGLLLMPLTMRRRRREQS